MLVLALLLPALPVAARRGGRQTVPQAAAAVAPHPYRGAAAGVAGAAAVASPAMVARSPKTASADVAVEASREHEIPRIKDPANLAAPLAPAGSNRLEDSSGRLEGRGGLVTNRAAAAPIASFEGPDYTKRIPPDPIAAAGPNHIVAAVNSKFGFFDKSGTSLYESAADDWFRNVLPQVQDIGGTFDPKVVYDQAAGRWLIVYLATDSINESWVLVSVSSTSDPLDTWCNIPLRGDRNGSTPSGNWSDYEGVGLDSQAVYITTNQFQLTPNADGKFQYARIRIIPKSQLYGGCVSPSYFDFYDLTDPVSTNERAFTLRPALTHGSPGVEYLVSNSPFVTSTYFTLWSIANPASGSPSLTAVNVPVTASTAPPNANQYGGTGGTPDCPAPCLIDTGDGRLLDLVYREGSLWTSHAIAGGAGDAYTLARYVRIGVSGAPAVLEDTAIGLDGCWYYYPAVAVDQNNNLGMVFTRSCTDTYPGIRYTGRTPADTDLQGSTLLKAGESNYVNPASGKNRWGDYSGASVDPADPTKIWFIGEYSATTTNRWGTWMGEAAITSGGGAGCVPSATSLCLNNSRFRVSATFQSPSGSGNATGVALTGDTGYFWFFSANNVEIVIKVVDGRAFNSRFWVFAGGLTNVNVVITVTDTQTGTTRTYTNPQGVAFQPIQDTNAFSLAAGPGGGGTSAASPVAEPAAAISAELSRLLKTGSAQPARPEAPTACTANATTLCLNNGRFSVRTQWNSPTSGSGNGQAVALTGDTGYFWFFSANNIEMVTKAVTGCGFNSRYWVFAGGLTNVNVIMTVTDTATGAVKIYVNPQNTAFQPIQDTAAFNCP